MLSLLFVPVLDKDIGFVDVSESAVIEMPSNQSKKMSPKPVGQSGASRVCELVETPIERSVHCG